MNKTNEKKKSQTYYGNKVQPEENINNKINS